MKVLDSSALQPTSSVPLMDSHVHIDSKEYRDDWREVIERARGLGVAEVVVPATNLASSRRIAELARECAWLHPTAGIHPHDADSFGEATAAELLTQLQATPCVAIGETGLEQHYDFCPFEQQLLSLRAHLRLARETELPLILHCRSAEAELYRELSAVGPLPGGGVVHCFTGEWEWAERFLELGFHIGVGGLVTLASASQVHHAARECPLNRLLLETDGPFLTPRPHRGRRNEPSMITLIAAEVARLREIAVDELAVATTRNCRALFRLPAEQVQERRMENSAPPS